MQALPGAVRRAQPTFCSWSCVAVCLSIAGAAVQAAPPDLSNESLDSITAEDPGRSLTSHQTGQPATNSQDSGSNNDIVDGAGIVVDRSSATAKFVIGVTLTDAAQQDVRAANIVNAAVSDSANGINVLSALDNNSSDEDDGFAASQSNLIEQTGAQRAELGRYSVADGASTRTFSETRSEYSFREKRSETQLIDRSGTVSLRDTEFHASVPATTLGDLVFDVAQPPKLPDIEIPLVKIGDTEYLKVVLEGPRLILGDVVWSDENGIELQSATLIFPTFKVFVKEKKVETISDEPIRVNIGPVTLLAIENPVDEFGALGFAAYGNGEIETTPGILSLTTEIDLKRILNLDDLPDIGIPGTEISIDSLLDAVLPVFEFGISTELDPFQGLANSFGSDAEDEMYCFPAESTTCNLIESTTDATSNEYVSTETSSSTESHSSGYQRSETFSLRASVEVQDAEAKIVVLGESSAKDERYHIVLVAEGSQNGMRVMNGVNTSNSITGNGINIIADQATARMPANNERNSYSQTNRITQIGGL